MRHPVERAYSYYVHLKRGSQVKETFEENIARTNICIDSSNYILQIEQYLKFFPNESFLFLLMDDLIHQPAEVLKQICRFIGVDDEIDLVEELIVANQAKKFFEDTNRSKITAPLRKIPGVRLGASLLPQIWRDKAYRILKTTSYGKWIEAKYIPSPMHSETYQNLLEHFREPNLRLAKFLDRDLSFWLR